jgi:hypothetical protein
LSHLELIVDPGLGGGVGGDLARIELPMRFLFGLDDGRGGIVMQGIKRRIFMIKNGTSAAFA